jgi:hypothetical protein
VFHSARPATLSILAAVVEQEVKRQGDSFSSSSPGGRCASGRGDQGPPNNSQQIIRADQQCGLWKRSSLPTS